MKKTLLAAILFTFTIGITACGGTDAQDVESTQTAAVMETEEEVPVTETAESTETVTETVEATEETGTEETESTEETAAAYTVKDMAATKYAKSAVNVRKGPSTDYEKAGSLSKNEKVTVTGQADTGWYRITKDGETVFVSDKYLADEKVKEAETASSQSGSSQTVTDTQAAETASASTAATASAGQASAETASAAAQTATTDSSSAGSTASSGSTVSSASLGNAQASGDTSSASGGTASGSTDTNTTASTESVSTSADSSTTVVGTFTTSDGKSYPVTKNEGIPGMYSANPAQATAEETEQMIKEAEAAGVASIYVDENGCVGGTLY